MGFREAGKIIVLDELSGTISVANDCVAYFFSWEEKEYQVWAFPNTKYRKFKGNWRVRVYERRVNTGYGMSSFAYLWTETMRVNPLYHLDGRCEGEQSEWILPNTIENAVKIFKEIEALVKHQKKGEN